MNEQDLRDCFAMFALNGLMASGSNDEVPYKDLASEAFEIADAMVAARSKKEEAQGIVAIKKKPRSRT